MKHVKGFIERKTMLRPTKVEYGDYTMNHVLGCAHGCKYPCYAFMMNKRFKKVKDYESWIEPYLVSNTLQLLDQEIPKLKDRIHSVQLCFSTDPFMYEYDEVSEMSIAAIKKLNEAGIKCTVLTKGILPVDLAEFSKENEYGITLVSLDEEFRRRMEPFSAPYQDRLVAMNNLHEKGCKTWVSIEPYPTPNLIEQSLNNLLDSVSFVDRIIFGRINYNREVTTYPEQRTFYNQCAHIVTNFCNAHKIAYYIKRKTITDSETDRA